MVSTSPVSTPASRKTRGIRRQITRNFCYPCVQMNDNGELSVQNSTLPALSLRSSKVCLQLMPGSCLLRTLSTSSLSAKEIQPALELWAEESLPQPIDSYYLDTWVISEQASGLAALPKAPLEKARQSLAQMGLQVMTLSVPELCPPKGPGVSIVLIQTVQGTLLCLWQDQVLYEWQLFVIDLPVSALVEQIAAVCQQVPASVYLDAAVQSKEISSAVALTWPDAQVIVSQDQNTSFPNHHFGASLTFDRYINEEKQQKATKTHMQTLGLAIAAAVMAGLFVVFANVNRMEREIALLQHQVSILNVRATRSENVTKRSGDALRKVRELRALTSERQGMMTVLRELSDTLPPRTRIENVTVERNGGVTLEGIAETQLDVSTLLERFERNTLFVTPNLTYVRQEDTRNDAESFVSFRIETTLLRPTLNSPGEAFSAPDNSLQSGSG